MKMQDAMLEMNNKKKKGYMVAFNWIGCGLLVSDCFPDKHAGEKLIETECEAWDLADRFARATKGRTCNLYVMSHDFKPVEQYKDRCISNR